MDPLNEMKRYLTGKKKCLEGGGGGRGVRGVIGGVEGGRGRGGIGRGGRGRGGGGGGGGAVSGGSGGGRRELINPQEVYIFTYFAMEQLLNSIITVFFTACGS